MVTVSMTMLLESVKVPHEVPLTFYIGGFLKYFVMMLLVVVFIPSIFLRIFSVHVSQKNKQT